MTLIASDDDITLFAKTNFRNRETPFGIRRDDRRRHMYIVGKTGMGKTTLIENMVIQDILHGHGVAFIDPHGDSVEKVLRYIPSNRINDVVYFNPADMDYPIAFNPLEAVDIKYKHLVASGLMGVFTKIWAGVWSARMEYILSNTILALLDSPGNTMLGIVRMYVDKAYRKRIVDNIKDPVIKSFWTDEFANYQDKFRTEAVAPIQNKVGQFLSTSIIRNIVGQTKSSIDLREIMDGQKIFLVNLSKGRIGEDSSALLGAMLITKLQLAAMSRVDIPEEERKDFYLYVDEFQNFATESFANILSEARKYRLNLIVAHQYIGQLINDRNTVVRDAIFGNVGTMITFRVGADDAEFLEKEFEPTYTMNDLVNLAKFNIYLKLMINGMTSQPFSAITLPPISAPTGNEEKVIAVSRERYATHREKVDEKIRKWLGAEFHAEAAKVESKSMDEEGAVEHMRFEHKETPGIAADVANPSPATTPPDKIVEVRKEARKDREERFERREERPRQEQRRSDQPRREDRGSRQERRIKQQFPHPNRRASDKQQEKATKKTDNPIWDTVNKLSTEKLKESVEETTSALDMLSKTLESSLKPITNAPEPKAQPVLAEKLPTSTDLDDLELEPKEQVQDKKLFPTEVKKIDNLPHSSSASSKQGTLNPGDKIQF
jgi:hypothetical protein